MKSCTRMWSKPLALLANTLVVGISVHGSRAFPVDLGFAGLLVLRLGYPHLLEGTERGEDGSAYPRAKAPLLSAVGSDQLEPHVGGSLHGQIPIESLVETGDQRVAAGDYDGTVERWPQIHIAHTLSFSLH